MSTLIFLLIVFSIIVFILKLIIGIIYRIRRKASFKRMSKYINSLKNINPARNFICFDESGYFNRAFILDESSRMICILNQVGKTINHKIYKFEDILSSQISENGNTITKTSLDNAIVGGLLFGKTGAIVGGVTGNKSTVQKVTEIALNLVFNDKNNPFYKFIITRSPDGMSKSDRLYINGWNDVNQWHNIFSLIIEENKKAEGIDPSIVKKNGTPLKKVLNDSDSFISSYNFNVSEELMKLSKLKENGVLTSEEFDNQKQKLLNTSKKRGNKVVRKNDEEVYDVILNDSGSNKIKVIKKVREITGMGLREAKNLVDKTPNVVVQNVSKDNAAEIIAALETVGATSDIK